ncbi:hypothetical protein Hanom_Chr13g01192871 [Helianthus anomalus]
MDGVNEPDENGKISNLLNPDAEKQTLGRSRKTSQTWTKMPFYSLKKERSSENTHFCSIWNKFAKILEPVLNQLPVARSSLLFSTRLDPSFASNRCF